MENSSPAIPSTLMVRTSIGPLPIWARGGRGDGPVLLGIRGAFAPLNQLDELSVEFPELDVVTAHLPGLITPAADLSIPAFARAMDELVSARYAGRSVIVLGVSVGGLVALSLQNEAVGEVIAVDPPLATGKLWPLRDGADAAWDQMPPNQHEWARRILGLDRTATTDISYRWVVENLRRPATVVAATTPLHPRRRTEAMPSLLDEDDIGFLRDSPQVRLTFAEDSGHDVMAQRPDVIFALIRSLLDQAPEL